MNLTCHDTELLMECSALSRRGLDVVRVGNLPLKTSQEDLRELFAQYGEIYSVDLVLEEDAELSGCCGWIYMRQASVAIEALDQADFKGRRLTVRLMGAFIPFDAPNI